MMDPPTHWCWRVNYKDQGTMVREKTYTDADEIDGEESLVGIATRFRKIYKIEQQGKTVYPYELLSPLLHFSLL